MQWSVASQGELRTVVVREVCSFRPEWKFETCAHYFILSSNYVQFQTTSRRQLGSSMQRSLINSTFSQRWERLQKDWEPLLSFISVSDFEKIVHWPPLFSIQYYARIDFYFVFALVSAAECFWTFKESRGWPGWLVHKAGRQAAAAAGVSPICNGTKIFFKVAFEFL